MNILSYIDFINEATTLASLKTKERLKSGIVANKQNLADLGSKIRDKTTQDRRGKVQELNDKIKNLTISKKEEKDSSRRHEISKQIQKYIKERNYLNKVNYFWGG